LRQGVTGLDNSVRKKVSSLWADGWKGSYQAVLVGVSSWPTVSVYRRFFMRIDDVNI